MSVCSLPSLLIVMKKTLDVGLLLAHGAWAGSIAGAIEFTTPLSRNPAIALRGFVLGATGFEPVTSCL